MLQDLCKAAPDVLFEFFGYLAGHAAAPLRPKMFAELFEGFDETVRRFVEDHGPGLGGKLLEECHPALFHRQEALEAEAVAGESGGDQGGDAGRRPGKGLDLDAFRAWRPDYKDAEFVLENGEYICGWAIEKMSKSMYNVVNPDNICNTYGADTLRLYEMFLGPIEQAKPWDTKGIDGVNRFLKKFWRLFWDRDKFLVNDEKPTADELKALHKLIGKEQEDIENFSYNTTISAFMIALNDLGNCSKREILEPLVVLLSPFAPHIAEELWHQLGHETSVTQATFPEYRQELTVDNSVKYPVSFNGKTRFFIDAPASATPADVEALVRGHESTPKYVGELSILKVIVVPGRIVNVVLKK